PRRARPGSARQPQLGARRADRHLLRGRVHRVPAEDPVGPGDVGVLGQPVGRRAHVTGHRGRGALVPAALVRARPPGRPGRRGDPVRRRPAGGRAVTALVGAAAGGAAPGTPSDVEPVVEPVAGKKRRRWTPYLLLVPGGLWLLLFFVVPTVQLAGTS